MYINASKYITVTIKQCWHLHQIIREKIHIIETPLGIPLISILKLGKIKNRFNRIVVICEIDSIVIAYPNGFTA